MNHEPTPAEERLSRRATASLIRAESTTLRALREASAGVVSALLVELASIRSDQDRRAVAEQAMRRVYATLGPMRDAIARATVRGKDNAETAALAQFDAQWEHVRKVVLEASGEDPGAPVAAPWSGRKEAAGALVGQSYSAAWGATVLASINQWQASDKPAEAVVGVAKTASKATDYRLRNIATSETTREFSDAFEGAATATLRTHTERNWYAAIFKQWDASADKATCKVCAGLAGSIRPIGIGYPGGASPGYVHPGCRCFSVIIVIPTRIDSQVAA